MDLRFALRSLRRSPGFALGAILVLALGIGVNTAIFSVVNAILLQPLGYPDPDRIVALETFWKNDGHIGSNVSGPDFHDWQNQNQVIAQMAYHMGWQQGTVVVNGAADYAGIQYVTPGFFAVFGIQPVVGRFFEQDAKQAAATAVVSRRWAESRFGQADAAVGKTVKADGRVLEISGVAPADFHYPANTDLWLPAGLVPETTHRLGHNYKVVGRLKPEVTLAEAQQQMRALGDRLGQVYVENKMKTVAVSPLRDKLTRNVRGTLWVLLGAVALVLLIACANVANLLLVRATRRTREIAVRTAVGASQGRIVRQLLTESFVLAFLASVAGLGLAALLLQALIAFAPANVPRLEAVRVDGAVLLFTLLASLFTSVLFGLGPALGAVRMNLHEALKQAGGKGAVVAGGGRLRSALVVVEVALSVILLVGAGLLLRSFQTLYHTDLGFTADRLLVAETDYAQNSEEEAKRGTEFYRELLLKIRALPGVTQAAGARFTPLKGGGSNGSYQIDGQAGVRTGDGAYADFQVVTPGYFATLGIGLRGGREFRDDDRWDHPMVAIINESLARRSFAGVDPVGHRIQCGFDSNAWMEIVGVVADSRGLDPATAPRPELYMPYQQHPRGGVALSILTRTPLEPAAVASALREAIRSLNPEVPVKMATMNEVFAQSLSYPRFRTVLIGVFAVLAALLAMVGVFSVMAYLVTQRTAEIGIRMALGAQARDVASWVLVGGLRLTLLGVALGMLGAAGLSRVLRSLLFGVSGTDPLTYVAVAALLGAAALVACAIPAARAARVDPLIALRQE